MKPPHQKILKDLFIAICKFNFASKSLLRAFIMSYNHLYQSTISYNPIKHFKKNCKIVFSTILHPKSCFPANRKHISLISQSYIGFPIFKIDDNSEKLGNWAMRKTFNTVGGLLDCFICNRRARAAIFSVYILIVNKYCSTLRYKSADCSLF